MNSLPSLYMSRNISLLSKSLRGFKLYCHDTLQFLVYLMTSAAFTPLSCRNSQFPERRCYKILYIIIILVHGHTHTMKTKSHDLLVSVTTRDFAYIKQGLYDTYNVWFISVIRMGNISVIMCTLSNCSDFTNQQNEIFELVVNLQ